MKESSVHDSTSIDATKSISFTSYTRNISQLQLSSKSKLIRKQRKRNVIDVSVFGDRQHMKPLRTVNKNLLFQYQQQPFQDWESVSKISFSINILGRKYLTISIGTSYFEAEIEKSVLNECGQVSLAVRRKKNLGKSIISFSFTFFFICVVEGFHQISAEFV